MTEHICYLHVGTGKTGSSAIQYALTASADYLRSRGFLYHDFAENFHRVLALTPTSGNAARIKRAVQEHDVKRASAMIEPLAGAKEHLILSCEGFANLDAADLASFGAALRSLGYTTRCLVFFRPQHERILSSYLQLSKSGKASEDLDSFARRKVSQDRLNWFDRAKALEAAFGDLIARWYPAVVRGSGVVGATFDWLGISAPVGVRTTVVNPTPGQEALIVMREMNGAGKREVTQFLNAAHGAGLLGSSVRLAPDTMKAVHDASYDSNVALFLRYLPELSIERELVLPAATELPAIDEGTLQRLRDIAHGGPDARN